MNLHQREIYFAEKEAERLAKEERLRQHNEMLELKRREKSSKIDVKMSKVDFLKQQESLAYT